MNADCTFCQKLSQALPGQTMPITADDLRQHKSHLAAEDAALRMACADDDEYRDPPINVRGWNWPKMFEGVAMGLVIGGSVLVGLIWKGWL